MNVQKLMFALRVGFFVCLVGVPAGWGVAFEGPSQQENSASQQGSDDVQVVVVEDPIRFYPRGILERTHSSKYVMIARFERATEEAPDERSLPSEFNIRIARQGDFLWARRPISREIGIADPDPYFYLNVLDAAGDRLQNAETLRKFARAYREGRVSIQRYLVIDEDEHPDPNPANGLGGASSHHMQLRYYSNKEISEAEAQEIISSFRQLQQIGVYQPIQESLTQQVARNAARAEVLPPVIAKLHRAHQAATDELAELAPIEPETLVELKAKRRLLAVDVAGTQAKVDKCAAILTTRANDMNNQFDDKAKEITRTIEALKLEAEIELAGLSAREMTIREMIEAADRRIVLLQQINSDLSPKLNDAKKEMRSCEAQVKYLEKQKSLYVPLELMKNEVEIRPVRYVVQN